MPMKRIGRQVSYLRRFARAVCGSQRLGDHFVGETLKAVLVGRLPPMGERGLRLALYGAFVRIWRRRLGNVGAGEDFGYPIDRKLQALVPMSRVVFLLTAMEGFDEAEVAQITGCSRSDIARYLGEAQHDLGHQLETRVLIIEDEWLIAAELKRIVESMGHVVVGQATRADTAIAQASLLDPGLILADIRLDRERAGLEAVDAILQRSSVPVVFVTAFPESLARGAGLEPTYLVEKPFFAGAIKAAVSQALFFENALVTRN